MQELLDKDIWAEARRKKGRGRITCAISYVNADHLQLRTGDRLLRLRRTHSDWGHFGLGSRRDAQERRSAAPLARPVGQGRRRCCYLPGIDTTEPAPLAFASMAGEPGCP